MNKNTSGWSSFSNVERDKDYFIFNISDAYVLSPTFAISANTNVDVTLGVYAYHTNATVSYTPTVYVMGSSTPVKNGASLTINGKASLVGVEGCTNKTFATSMSNSAKNISIYVYGKKNGWDYPEFFINYCKIAYRQIVYQDITYQASVTKITSNRGYFHYRYIVADITVIWPLGFKELQSSSRV